MAASAPLVPDGVFEPRGLYFDSPTYGLTPMASYEAILRAARRWSEGSATMAEYDEAVARSRELFAHIVGVAPASVAIGANVSSLVGPVAAALPSGSTVLVPDGGVHVPPVPAPCQPWAASPVPSLSSTWRGLSTSDFVGRHVELD